MNTQNRAVAVATESARITRRRLIRAGAWSVPVVLAAATAPLSAASGAIRISAVAGDVIDGLHVTFQDVAPGDQMVLVFHVAEGAGDYAGDVVATLQDEDVLAWDPALDPAGTTVTQPAEDGDVVLPVAVQGLGEVLVRVSAGAVEVVFTVTIQGG